MGSIRVLTNRQWRLIENILPPTRHDPAVISAILYRQHSGQSLSHAAELFGVTRARLHEWDRALAADGSLAQILKALKLEPASALARRRGGRPFYHRDPKMVAAVTELRLRNFADALRGR